LADLTRAAARLREADAAEASALAEINAMAAADIASMTKWATEGCHGSAPRPDQQKRIVLGQQLSAAQAAATVAKAAGADVDQKIAQLNDQLHAISGQLEQAIFDTIEVEHGHIIAQYRAACEQGSKLSAKIHGLASFYGDTGRTLIDRGDQAAGATYLQRASALTNIKLPNPGVSRLEIEAAALEWSRRAATLRSGA